MRGLLRAARAPRHERFFFFVVHSCFCSLIFFFFFCFLSNLDFRNEQPLSWIAPLHNHTPTKRQPIHEFVPMIPTISNIALLAPLQSSTDQSADLVKWSTLVVSLAASAFKH